MCLELTTTITCMLLKPITTTLARTHGHCLAWKAEMIQHWITLLGQVLEVD